MKFICTGTGCQYESVYRGKLVKHLTTCTAEGAGMEMLDNDMKCDYCKADFSTSQKLIYHMHKTCENRPIEERLPTPKASRVERINTKFEVYDLAFLELRNRVEELEKLIKQYKPKVPALKNIKMRNFPMTDYEFISPTDYESCMSEMMNMVPKLIRMVHFNHRHPENHNIFISNPRSGRVNIFEENRWNIRPVREVVKEVIELAERNIMSWAEDDEKTWAEYQRYEKLKEQVSPITRKTGEQDLIEAVKDLLYNNRPVS